MDKKEPIEKDYTFVILGIFTIILLLVISLIFYGINSGKELFLLLFTVFGLSFYFSCHINRK